MANKKTGYIGIDIGSHAIKMAQVEMRGAALKLVDAVSLPRPTPWDPNASQRQLPLSSSNEIKAAYSIGEHFRGKKTASTASMALCDVRKMTFVPSPNDGLNRKMIESQFKSIERFADEPRSFDYWPVADHWNSEQPGVFVMSLRQSWALQIANDHTQSRMKCKLLDGIPMALSRAVQLASPTDIDRPVAIIDWGYTRATFCLAFNGVPVFVRMLRNSGFGRIVQQVANELEIPLRQAETVLREQGLATDGEKSTNVQRALSVIIKESTKIVVDEVAKTLNYLRSDRNNPVPAQLKLFGGGATMRGVTSLFSEQKGLETSVWGLPFDSGNSAGKHCPLPLLGPAIAMSTLAWSQA